ncbi:MAG: hypothetical protein FJX72_01410, partial [Armatimonadetes bacterium]|nr:hypothetical protein [Armatimonadota bacterium]
NVSFDGKRVLVSLRHNAADDYHIYEVTLPALRPSSDQRAGAAVRQITFGSGLSDIDPAYLPDGSIVFASTREPKVCHCNRHIQANLFRMAPDGSGIHQIGRNTLFEGHPAVLPDGRILYERWEYVDKHFGPAFGLWTCSPDGTNHALFYGNVGWAPGAMLDARPMPDGRRVALTFGSCHDRPWGGIAVVDSERGFAGPQTMLHTWPGDLQRLVTNRRDYGDGRGGHPSAGQIDNTVGMRPKYEDPYPLTDRFLLASRMVEGERMGLFLLDARGPDRLIHVEGAGCYDPMPIAPRPIPARIADHARKADDFGAFYVGDVYAGDGMVGVRRGTIKSVRVVEAPPKLLWGHGLWNIDATQAPAMNWNCTNSKQILGDAPLHPDGSAYFRVPADRFVYFQLLDADGMMVQTMRSGTMVRPGETRGCVGCHDNRRTGAPNRRPRSAMKPPSRLTPWNGPARPFNYRTEVQPVFDRKCVSCHDYGKPAGRVLNLAGDVGLAFNASYIELRGKSALRWFPDPPGARKLLVKAVDDGPAEALPPMAWGSHRSRLVEVLRAGHQGVRLTPDEMSRIVTWIDLNAPYYGSYATDWPNNAFGRSPLDHGELARLAALTGVPVGSQDAEIVASQVSFSRPALSPCLVSLQAPGKESSLRDALAVIETGAARLRASPRADMPGHAPAGPDARALARYDTRTREQDQGWRDWLRRSAR